jgi:hypothetical protein
LTGSDFDNTAAAVAKHISFAERLGRGDAKAEPGEAKDESAAGAAYKPYGYMPSGGITETCDVQRWLENSQIAEGIEFQYRFLMQIGYVGEEQLKLFLPDCIVVIEGSYLRDLRKKLARRQVTFIQQYSSRVWRDAPAKGEPIIEKIEVVRPQPAEDPRRNT